MDKHLKPGDTLWHPITGKALVVRDDAGGQSPEKPGLQDRGSLIAILDDTCPYCQRTAREHVEGYSHPPCSCFLMHVLRRICVAFGVMDASCLDPDYYRGSFAELLSLVTNNSLRDQDLTISALEQIRNEYTSAASPPPE